MTLKKYFKILSVMIAFVVLFSGAQSGFATGDMYEIGYYVEDNHAIVACQATWITGNVVIDSTYEGYPVTEFQEPSWAYVFSSGVTSITLPNSIDAKKLTGYPFCGCPDAKIILAHDNTELLIEGNVLYNKDKTKLIRYQNNPNDNSFTVPESVVEIADYAFTGSNIENLTILNKNIKINFRKEDDFGSHNIKNVYYNGSREEWIENEIDNEYGFVFGDAEIHYLSSDSPSSSTDTNGFMSLIVMFVNTTIVPLLNMILDFIGSLILSLT